MSTCLKIKLKHYFNKVNVFKVTIDPLTPNVTLLNLENIRKPYRGMQKATLGKNGLNPTQSRL